MPTSENSGTGRAKHAGKLAISSIRSILASRELTLHRVSRESEHLYGPDSPFSIPHTLYHSMGNSASFLPSLPQVCALSRISGYRLEDWLYALGIKTRQLAGLQAALPFRRTRLIDPAFDGEVSSAGGFEAISDAAASRTVPFGQLFRWVPRMRSCDPREERSSPLFARIGCEDAFAYPELLPGSIVRLDNSIQSSSELRDNRPRLLLVECEQGLWCGRFHPSADGILHAAAAEAAYAPLRLRIPQEARVLGRVDMEIRWMHRLQQPLVPRELVVPSRRDAFETAPTTLGGLIRRARTRAGLTLQEASRLCRLAAEALGEPRYAMAESSLSEYEVQNVPPRHLEKVLSLCLIYGIPLRDLIAAAGVVPEHLGRDPIPSQLLGDDAEDGPRSDSSDGDGSSGSLVRRTGAIPWFLHGCLPALSGIPVLSLRDVFWLSGDHPFLPAHTGGSLLALVDRRRKRPARIPDLPAWFQPAYILLLRNGRYCCACCSREGETLFLCPSPESGRVPQASRAGHDAEVIGQIVALARRIE